MKIAGNNNLLVGLIVAFVILLPYRSSQINPNGVDLFVYEMDDRIIEYSSQGKWLIIFYAPWCGHCRKLETILDDIGKYYRDRMVNVAKVDATKYVKSSNHFEIRGYPTIK
jgi:thioredoxin domain-containing protein 10